MPIKRNRFIFTGLVFILLLMCVLFSEFKAFSYISLTVYLFYWMYLYRIDKTYFVKYLAFIFCAVATVVGATIIELLPEVYLKELNCQSHFSGSLPLLIFSYWIFLYVLEIRDYHYGKLLIIQIDYFSGVRAKKIINLFAAVCSLLLFVVFLYVSTHTLPSFMYGVDRIDFNRTYAMPWLISKLYINIYLLIVFPLLALIYANRLIGIISIILYCILNFWTGEKFGAFFSLLCILLIVLYNKVLSVNIKVLKRILRFVAVIFCMMVVIAVNIFSSSTDLNPYEYFSQRSAQQGQLWWRTYDLYNGETHPSEFQNEIKAFFEGDKSIQNSVGAENGIYKVMYLCAPKSVVSSVLGNGVRYTQADYAVMYYYFGVLGVIVYSILMGIIISSIVNTFILSLQKKDYIKAMIYLRFFVLIRASFSMFTFGSFLSTLSILSYVYLIFTHGRQLKL